MPGVTGAENEPVGSEASRRTSNNFNFLRLLFASLVILTHSVQLVDGTARRDPLFSLGLPWPLSTLAVDGFFLLSGFLITQSWLRDPHLGKFLRKRALRIYPGFLAAVMVSALVFGPLGGNPEYWREFDAAGFLYNAAWLTLKAPDAFPGLPDPVLNRSLWTIPYEFLCYLLVAALGCTSLLRRRAIVLAGWAGCMALYAWQLRTGRSYLPQSNYLANLLFSSARLAGCFLAGSCFYLYRDRIRYSAVGVAACMALLWAASLRGTTSHLLLPVFFGYLVFASAFAKSRPLAAFGTIADVSYGMYLYAWPVQNLIIYHHRRINPYLLSAITFVLCYGIGLLSWYAVERPFLRLKPPATGRQSRGPHRADAP